MFRCPLCCSESCPRRRLRNSTIRHSWLRPRWARPAPSSSLWSPAGWSGGCLSAKATLAGLAGSFGNIGYMGPGLALAVLGAKAAAPTALIFCCDAIFLFTIVPLLIALTDGKPRHWLHTLALVVQQIVFNPLIMSACAGALAAALHFHPPVAIDNTLQFLQNAAAPTALFVLGVTVALRPFGRVLMASLPPALNVFVIARQHDTWIEPASVAVLIGTFAAVITLTSVMWFIHTGRLVVS